MATSGARTLAATNPPGRVVTVGNPAAGADWTFTLTQPGTLVAVNCSITTSAVVANRVPRLRISDNAGHILADQAGIAAETASTTVRNNWFAGAVSSGVGGEEAMGLPLNLGLGTGWIISVSTANIDVGDQWSGIVLTFAG